MEDFLFKIDNNPLIYLVSFLIGCLILCILGLSKYFNKRKDLNDEED